MKTLRKSINKDHLATQCIKLPRKTSAMLQNVEIIQRFEADAKFSDIFKSWD